MKFVYIVVTLYLCLFFTKVSMAQSHGQCVRCNMDIKDLQFRAMAETNSGKTLQFDAIECLVNYLKANDENNFQKLQVTDYKNGRLIDAVKAYYLKSKSIPSPMGADLSAYSSKSAASSVQEKIGGEVYMWKALKERFVSSNFGAVQHTHHNHNRPEAYAPSSIMGEHLHPQGGFMVSLRYMNMNMNGNREGSDKINDETIYERFIVAPQDMTMQMYMLGVMYAPSDKLTLMLMQNFVKKDMDLTARMMMGNGMPMLNNFYTSSSGLGDLKLGLLFGIHERERNSFHLNAGFNIPIGEIKNRDATPMMANAKLPYTMQLGTGTLDVTLGGTLKGTCDKFSWGIQQLNTFRTGSNSEDYRFGNFYELHTWAGYAISGTISTSIRLSGSIEGDINGADSELNPLMVTTADPDNYGGELVRGAIGVNVLLADNKLLFGGEIGTPLYQNYNGIFMNEDLTVNAGLKYTVF